MAKMKKKKAVEFKYNPEAENPVRKPNEVLSYTPHQIQELKRCAEDIFYFIENYVWVVHPTKGHVRFILHDYQKVIIKNLITYKDNALMVSRQMGKSQCAVIYMLWLTTFFGQKTVLVVSNIQNAAIENIDRFKYSYEYLPNWMKAGVEIYNRGSVHFDNKSKIVARATTKNSGRGLSPALVFVDELSFVDTKKQKEFWSAISPTLSTGGKCIVASTPNNDEDLFAQICRGAENIYDDYGNENPNGLGRNGFKFTKFTWEANPERDVEWEKVQRAKDGDEFFEREHNCKFIGFDETLIDAFTLARLQGINHEFIKDNVRWWSKPEPGKTYLISLDPSLGTGRDPAAIQVFELPDLTQVAEWQHNKTPIPLQVKLLREITKYIEEQTEEPENIYWSIENNDEGANIVVQDLGEDNFAGTYLSQKGNKSGSVLRKGFWTSNKAKVESCMRLKSLVERDKIHLNSKPLVSQLKQFVRKGSGFAAKSSEHDDLVSSTLIMIRMLQRVMNYDDSFRENLQETIDNKEFRQPLGMLVSRQEIPIIN